MVFTSTFKLLIYILLSQVLNPGDTVITTFGEVNNYVRNYMKITKCAKQS